MARGRRPSGERALTAAERQTRARALKRFNTSDLRFADDLDRDKPMAIAWDRQKLQGRLTVGGEYWAAVEWSQKHQCWCIEDVTGACLAHEDGIRGAAATEDAAVALAEAMIRDGRMPSPQEAWRHRQESRWQALPEAERERIRAAEAAAKAEVERKRRAREKRARQPAVQRREAEKKGREAAFLRAWDAERRTRSAEAAAAPLYEVLNDIFDFADPELWKSNSFAALRPRLVIHVEAVVARLESHLASRLRDVDTDRWGTYRTQDERQADRERAQEACRPLRDRLERARGILAALRGLAAAVA